MNKQEMIIKVPTSSEYHELTLGSGLNITILKYDVTSAKYPNPIPQRME